MRYIPNSPEERDEMLKIVGLNSEDELFRSIPPAVQLNRALKITEPLAELEVVMKLDGEERGRGTCASVLGDPVDSVVWIANALSAEGLGLAAGHLVPIGTWTGLHFIHAPAQVRADFGPLGAVEITFR